MCGNISDHAAGCKPASALAAVKLTVPDDVTVNITMFDDFGRSTEDVETYDSGKPMLGQQFRGGYLAEICLAEIWLSRQTGTTRVQNHILNPRVTLEEQL